MSNTIFNDRTGFELYLEGIKVPFNAITVREIEGGYPTADISFPATSGILQTLPGTVVQFFGPEPGTENTVLLYEGEITGYSYRKNQGGRYINFSSRCFLDKWKSITARPADAMVTKKYKAAAGENNYAYYHLSNENKDAAGQESNSRYSQIVKSLEEAVSAKVFGKLEGALSDIRFTESYSFVDEITRLFSDDNLVDGDIDVFLKYMLRKFEIFDPYYGIQANSFGISSSIAAFPNVDKVKVRKAQTILEGFFTIAQETKNTNFTSNALVLMTAVQQLLTVLKYSFIAPSTPTSSYQFWSNKEGSAETRRPVRGYMLPSLEHSPPAKFNTFFSHQVEDFNFSRNFYSEPTRTIGSYTIPYFNVISDVTQGLEAFVIEPNVDLTKEGSDQNSVGFTPEESYQGIRPMFKKFDRLLAGSTERLDMENKQAVQEEKVKEITNELNDPLQSFTQSTHYDAKYANRGCNLRAVWSPHRMVGVPGVYIEAGDGPSFIGQVSAITNVYDGRGNVSSTVSMRSVRVVEDMRELLKDSPTRLGELINEFTRDPFPDINNNLYDPNLYKFDKIGETIYPFLTWGSLAGDPDKAGEAVLKKYAEEGTAFSDYSANIDSIYSTGKAVKKEQKDCSILSVLARDDNENIATGQSEDLLSKEAQERLHRSSANYTKYVYLSVYKLKDKYNTYDEDDAKGLDKFSTSFTYRKLTTKEEYLSSVNVNQANGLSDPVNYKDGMEIFTGTNQMVRVKDTIDLQDSPGLEEILESGEISLNLRERRVLLSRLGDLSSQMSAGVLKTSEGDTPPDSLFTGYKQPVKLDTPDFNMIDYSPIEDPSSVNGLKKDVTLAKDFKETKEKLKKVNARLEELGVNLETLTVEIETVGKTFENEVFKPYNLTRKRHIEFGFTRYIRDNFKDLRVIE